MTAINMPGFTAEESLYKSHAEYRMNTSKLVRAEANIFPQLKISATGRPGSSNQLSQICQQIGEIVNDFYQDGIDSSSPTAKDSQITANNMYNRSKKNCSFSVQ